MTKVAGKTEYLIKKIDAHLRKTARQIIQFDTVDETLHFLLESFWSELTCDFVAISFKQNNTLVPRVWKGATSDIQETLTLDIDKCSPTLLTEALWWQNNLSNRENDCQFQRAIQTENFSSWFTVPLKNEHESFGYCVIGFRDFVPLILELDKVFKEFGKDIASAIQLAKKREIQKRKISGVEWLKEKIFPGSSIEELVGEIVEIAGKVSQARFACVYLYDEKENCFFFQPPAFGEMNINPKIIIESNQNLITYFPSVEKTGNDTISIPLIVNLKTIGVIHVINKEGVLFSQGDLEFLQFLSSHVSILIENARLYKTEKELNKRLHTFMQNNQKLVEQTVAGENFDNVSLTLSSLLRHPVILLDKFLRPISYHFPRDTPNGHLQSLIKQLQQCKETILNEPFKEKWLTIEVNGTDVPFGIRAIIGGGDLLGYLLLLTEEHKVDHIMRLTLDHAINVYAIQFVKQKLVIETKEQVKESFITQLLEKKVAEKEKIIQYANLINWDILSPHRMAVLSLHIDSDESDLLIHEEKKSFLWEQIKEHMAIYEREAIFTRLGHEFILIVPADNEKRTNKKAYWTALYKQIKQLVQREVASGCISLGIGGLTESLEDYYSCYKQAVLAHKIAVNNPQKIELAFFEELGAYTILYNLHDRLSIQFFVQKYLGNLLNHANENRVNLFETLRAYLNHNGNIKETSRHLFIHRSTLLYRLEKISELLQVDFDDAEERFNLMMAYKLYDLYVKE